MSDPTPSKRARESPSPPLAQPARYIPPHRQQQQQHSPASSNFHPIQSAYSYTPAAGHAPTAFQLPTHLSSFSYSPSRELLLTADRQDEALSHYAPPPMGADLNRGFEQCEWGEGRPDEGLDALLLSLAEWLSRDTTVQAEDQLAKVQVLTWRGMMTKLMMCLYEAESFASSGGRARADTWEMNAMIIDGALYLEDSTPPKKRAAKAREEASYKIQSYYGYAFEAYSTVPPPPEGHDRAAPPTQAFEPPNTNVQWCSVVKSNLGGIRFIVGGEVDCVQPSAVKGRIKTDDFCELKTNIAIGSHRDEVNFEKNKLLKHYVQSFLLGVPLVVVGFRTRDGFLTGLQSFKTLEIPRLVRGKPHAWDPLACLASARKILAFLLSSLSSHPATEAYHNQVDALAEGEQIPRDAPVFRVSFDARGEAGAGAGVSVRLLGENEVKEGVLGAKQEGERVGFLLESWVKARLEQRRKRKAEQNSDERVPSPHHAPAPPPPSAQREPAPFVLQR